MDNEPELWETLERAWYNISEQHGRNKELEDDLMWLYDNIASFKTKDSD